MAISDERLWEFQTRLMENVVGIYAQTRRNTVATGAPNANEYHTYNGTIPPVMTERVGNPAPLENTTGSVSILSETDLETTANYKFVDLPASIAELLTPKVKVYKVYKNPEGSQLPDRAYLLHQGMYPKDEINRALADGSVTGADDNMQGVVLQAVEFTRLGGNPAEVHTNIKFNIRLYAKSITEFFRKTDSFPDVLSADVGDFGIQSEFQEKAAVYNRAALTVKESRSARDAAVQASPGSAGASRATAAFDASMAALTALEGPMRANRQAYVAETGLKRTAWIDIIKIDPGQEIDATIDTPSTPQPPAAPTVGSLQVVESDVRIKVKIQYAISGGKPTDILPEAWVKWQQVIEEQKEVFFLSLLKHEFSFLGMTGVELSVDFVATGNAKMLQPKFDLFGGLDYSAYIAARTSAAAGPSAARDRYTSIVSSLRHDIVEHNKTIADNKYQNDLNSQAPASRSARVATSMATTAIAEANEKIDGCLEKTAELDEAQDQVETEISNAKGEYKMRLFKQLYQNHGVGSTPTNRKTRVFRVKLPSLRGSQRGVVFIPMTGELGTQVNSAQRYNVTNAESAAVTEPDGAMPTTAVLDEDDEQLTIGDFVFLGDIIESAFEVIDIQSRDDADSTVFTERTIELQAALTAATEFKDEVGPLDQQWANRFYAELRAIEELQAHLAALHPPMAIVPAADLEEALKELDIAITGKVIYRFPINPNSNTRTINISDIPISLDLFRAWWIGKARKMNSYPLRDFFPDVMAFVTDMFKNLRYRSGTNSIEMKDYDLPNFVLNNVLLESRSLTKRINETRKYSYRGEEDFLEHLSVSKAGSTARTATVIEQSNVSDMPSNNVPNIIFGQADRGILKQITFEREDIPGHAEARLMTDRESVSSNIALREKYNVSIETRGTTSFLPGSVLYLDITPIELGYTNESNSYAKQLGLGGMYRVVSVQSSISLDGGGNTWTTKLKTKWESFGDGTNGDPLSRPTFVNTENGCD